MQRKERTRVLPTRANMRESWGKMEHKTMEATPMSTVQPPNYMHIDYTIKTSIFMARSSMDSKINKKQHTLVGSTGNS